MHNSINTDIVSADITDELAVLQVSGNDCATFLQGQLSNDIRKLDNDITADSDCILVLRHQYSAYLNHKGRMLASFIVVKVQDSVYHLLTVKTIAAGLLDRLRVYVLRAKVKICLLHDARLLFANDGALLVVPDHASACASYLLQLSSDSDVTQDRIMVMQSDIMQASKVGHSWHRYLVNNGIPFIYPQTVEQFIPQYVNYDLAYINGVSFTKGCYVGQEIVARLHYLGKSKQRMYRFDCTCPTGFTLAIAQAVINSENCAQEIGRIVDVAANDDNDVGASIIGLAVLYIDHVNTAAVIVNNLTLRLCVSNII